MATMPKGCPGCTHDLNRLYEEAHWDKKLQRHVRNKGMEPRKYTIKVGGEAIDAFFDNAYAEGQKNGSIPKGVSRGEWLAGMGIV